MLPLALAALILLGYGASLWLLLRRETPTVLFFVLLLCSLSLSLRLVYTTDFPEGLNEDEVKTLRLAVDAARNGKLLEFGIEGPILLNALFQAPLVPILGPGRWAIRLYSIICSVLTTAAAFGVARGLRLRPAASLAAGALVAVLPWALLYGRVSFGGEMTFHQLLLLAALARLVWAEGDWLDVAMGALGLCLLLYDYTCGWAMLGMPLVGAVLARGRRRALCLAILALALAGWAPYMLRPDTSSWLPMISDKVPTEYGADPLATLQIKILSNLSSLIGPVARNGWMAVEAAAMHPPWLLALAALGACTGMRRGLFLWGGFIGAMAPSVFSEGVAPSSHRMLMMFPFIPLAVGCALDLVPRFWGGATAIIIVSVAAVQSITLYFSPRFWFMESKWIFDAERTGLVEALPLPPHPPIVISNEVQPFYELRSVVDPDFEELSVENWYPRPAGAVYAFGAQSASLRPFYEHLLGPERVTPVYRAFMVRFEAVDWTWMKRHGWAYEVHCGTQDWRGQVPALYQLGVTFAGAWCENPLTHIWRGRWEGPAVTLRLRTANPAVIETSSGLRRTKAESGPDLEIPVQPSTSIVITATGGTELTIGLFEITKAGERVPQWEYVTPIFTNP